MAARSSRYMTPMYRGLRWMFQVGVELFYVDVHLSGRDRIPDEAPVVFAANHPNSLMDTVVLGTQVDRQIHYLAKSELFAYPGVGWLFDQCGVIPLHRTPADGQSNLEAFEAAYELLGRNGCLGIFPEGQNSEERRVLEIKTGAARIALGAEARGNWELGVRIVPVGLNYERRDRFMTRVVARVGEPIAADTYAEKYRGNEREAVRELTDDLESSLHRVVAVIRDDRVRRLAEQLEGISDREFLEGATPRIDSDGGAAEKDEEGGEAESRGEETGRGLGKALLNRLKQASGQDARAFDRRLATQERIADAIEYFEEAHPELVERLRARVETYVDHVEQLRIRGELESTDPEVISTRMEAVKLTAYAILLAIPAAWGILNNLVPYLATRAAASQAPDEPRRAFFGLLAGLVCFTGAYAIQAWGIWTETSAGWGLTTAYVASLPAAGFFALRYLRTVARYRSRILVRTLFRTDRNLVDALLAERRHLLEVFEALSDHYGTVQEARERDETPPPPPELPAGAPLSMRLQS